MKQNHIMFLIVVVITALLGGIAWAEPTWICSISTAVASTDDGKSGPPDLGGLAAPTFLNVDAGAKRVTLLAPASRRGEVSQIDTLHREGNVWLFNGMERGRIWSMAISDDGHFTLAVIDDGEVWTVFGNALLETDIAVSSKP